LTTKAQLIRKEQSIEPWRTIAVYVPHSDKNRFKGLFRKDVMS